MPSFGDAGALFPFFDGWIAQAFQGSVKHNRSEQHNVALAPLAEMLHTIGHVPS